MTGLNLKVAVESWVDGKWGVGGGGRRARGEGAVRSLRTPCGG